VVGLVFGQDAARGRIDEQIQGLVGQDAEKAIEEMIAGSQNQSSGILAGILGITALLFGATGVFSELHDALNTIWEVEPKPQSTVMAFIKSRFLSFTLVLGIGFLLLVSLVISAGLSAVGAFFASALPGAELLWQLVHLIISLATFSTLFAMMFKVLPDAEIAWRDVWIGAVATAVLFTIGKFLIGFYLGAGALSSTYGAAGALVIILVWVYYSAQILFLGAEFTQVYARRFGSRIVPSENAIPLTEERRAEQGMPHKAPAQESASARTSEYRPVSSIASILAGVLIGLTVRVLRNSR
jgi:membrane protein